MLIQAPNDADLRALLLASGSIAIVGISDKPDRPSYRVADWLIKNSHLKVYFVNPLLSELFGRPVYRSLSEIPDPIDIVDVFRNISDAPQVLEDSISIDAKTFWLQLGLSDQDIYDRAQSAEMNIVMNRCSKIEYERLIES
ncbi:MAG: CoA-binding protein [Actinobacteria bacterium]|uniref:Unannotated protein n=1 Tax=freshwater metagenome TaxID=449393 RepID=A0A6J6FJ58_9ZZZZ|nr:CoA-binding protein [Actinomycetota bacterium]